MIVRLYSNKSILEILDIYQGPENKVDKKNPAGRGVGWDWVKYSSLLFEPSLFSDL
jgi:hypothetical protein